jgi:hypothetical protein
MIPNADPTGHTDSAPAFRAAIQSGAHIKIGPGIYLFASTQTAPCCAQDPPAVLVQGKSHFQIDGAGATIVTAPGIALSTLFHFDRDSDFSISGLKLKGSRQSLSLGQENVGIALTSDVGAKVSNIEFTGFGGNGTGMDGDWIVNSRFTSLKFEGVGQCFDVAFLKNVQIDHVTATADRGAAAAGVITKCFSFISDGPNAAQNHTGVAFDTNEDVGVSDTQTTGFRLGGYVSAGYRFHWSSNVWRCDTDRDSSVLTESVASGPFSSGAFAPKDISFAAQKGSSPACSARSHSAVTSLDDMGKR